MMKAFPFEYRSRYFVHTVIYALGFYAPWERYTSFTLGARTTWLLLASLPARAQWLSFSAASLLSLLIGCVLAILGAWLRVWGASYLGASIVHSSTMHGGQVMADGPYRRGRNPLYVGTFLNTLALALLMPPSGAIFALVLIGLVQLRLIGAEEDFLSRSLGEPYRAYCAVVPRLGVSLRPRIAPAGVRPHYGSGILSELFVIGTAVSFVALGWGYNSTPLLKGVVVSFGVSIIAQAFVPRMARTSPKLPA